MSDPNKLKPGSYIDTQGMGGPMTPEDLAKWKASPEYKKQTYKPAIVKPRRLFTDTYCKEMSILINEVLDAREGKMDYTSYFDTEEFKHPVTEDEPPYSRPITHDFEKRVLRKMFPKD
tara:strand:- start:1629 stop:1982 length:354 start_codon:yes stop_codon:yes gene_type:complete